MDFNSKIALVTGGTSGIGRATAIAFAREGAHVILTGRNQERGKETVSLIEGKGGRALFLQNDVSKESDIKNTLQIVMQEFGRLDFAFNNAGVEGDIAPVTEQSTENYDKIFDTNVRSVFLSMKYEIPAILQSGGGAIVNNSSVAGLVGVAGGMSLYVASKHAVIGLTKAAALEYASAGIHINAICPAVIKTEMFERLTKGDASFQAQLTALHPIGRLGEPEEVAEGVLWLCSDKASFMVGHALTVDGGVTAQ